MTNPSEDHWSDIKSIFRYIKENSDLALCFGES